MPTVSTKIITKYYHPKSLSCSMVDPSEAMDKCVTCKTQLSEPYIKCNECLNLLCLNCFSHGKETKQHRNTHPYIIVHDNFYVFPWTNWTANEEKLFLNSIQKCGHGNWEAISKRLPNRSPYECRQHYHECYFGGIFEKLLGFSKESYFPERMPYLFKMKSVDPPRDDDVNSMIYKSMAGYRCARGDFETPYDNSAESLISNLEDINKWPKEYRNVIETLNLSVIRAYNHRLA